MRVARAGFLVAIVVAVVVVVIVLVTGKDGGTPSTTLGESCDRVVAGPPKPTDQRPPAALLRAVSVLRRPRGGTDRLPTGLQDALVGTPAPAFARRLGRAAAGGQLFLVPTRFESGVRARGCASAGETVAGWGLQVVRSEEAQTFTLRVLRTNGVLLFGAPAAEVVEATPPDLSTIVPDGVATVRFTFPDGRVHDARVDQNFATVALDRGQTGFTDVRVRWTDASGRSVGPVGR